MRRFNRKEILSVVNHHDVPAEYHAKFVTLFTGPFNDRNYKRRSNRLFKQLGLLFVVVNNSFARLRWLTAEGIKLPKG